MHCYIAETSKHIQMGSIHNVINWSETQINSGFAKVAKIFHIRAGEKNAQLFAEITSSGIRLLNNGSTTNYKRLASRCLSEK